MSLLKRHFDAIILGDSLAARIAAVLLARSGKRVLSLGDSPSPSCAWTFSSLHLEKLLDMLDGASCRINAQPLQFLTDDIRLEINGPDSLEEELRREFPACHEELLQELRTLRQLGRRLEEILWIEGQLPLGSLLSLTRFTLRCLRSSISTRTLKEPVADYLRRRMPSPGADAFEAFFSGLSLTSSTDLSVAEAAMLWQGILRSTMVDYAALDELLRHRYRQFHGASESLDRLQSLHVDGRRLSGATLSGHGRISGDFFLIGSKAGIRSLPKNCRPPLTSAPAAHRYVSSHMEGGLLPLLAGKIVLGKPTPWRAAFRTEKGETVCCIEGPGIPGTEITAVAAEEALRPFLPFVDYGFSAFPGDEPDGPAEISRKRGRLGAVSRPQIMKNLLLCDGSLVLPGLGMPGEVLTAFHAAGRSQSGEKGKR